MAAVQRQQEGFTVTVHLHSTTSQDVELCWYDSPVLPLTTYHKNRMKVVLALYITLTWVHQAADAITARGGLVGFKRSAKKGCNTWHNHMAQRVGCCDIEMCMPVACILSWSNFATGSSVCTVSACYGFAEVDNRFCQESDLGTLQGPISHIGSQVAGTKGLDSSRSHT